nr:transposon TX1 [Tanacetum cinerariifolium]
MVQKKLNNRKWYDFVRFKNVLDVESMHKTLETIWIDKYKLRVFKAFDRSEKERGIHRRQQIEGGSRFNNTHHQSSTLKGGNINKPGVRDSRMVEVGKDERVLEVETSREGMKETVIKNSGGNEIMMDFGNEETTTNALNKIDHDIRQWVWKIQRWDESFRISGRNTWINIIGVPLACWTEKVFNQITMV